MHLLSTRHVLVQQRRLGALKYRHASYRARIMTTNPDMIVYGIIGVNVSVYLLWQQRSARRFMIEHFTTSVNHIKALRFHTLLTASISHFDTSHLFFNMLGLYFMGPGAIAAMGNWRFLQLYFFGGIFASCGQLTADYLTATMKSPNGRPPVLFQRRLQKNKVSLGASGSVSAVVAYSILMNPTATFYLYMIVPIPAALFGVYFVGKDIVGLFNDRSTVGNAAHLGGAAFGALTFMHHRRRLFR